MKKRIAVLAALSLAFGGAADAMIADFQNGTQGWSQGVNAPGTVTQELDAGPGGIGDHALGVLPRQTVPFRMNPSTTGADFIGDFIGTGVTEVTFQAMAPVSNTETVQLRAVIFRSFNQIQWISDDSAALPNDGVWRPYTFSLEEADMADATMTMNYAVDFANVERFGLRHQTVASVLPADSLGNTATMVFLDNITLPEPGAGATAIAALLGLGGLGRFRRSTRRAAPSRA